MKIRINGNAMVFVSACKADDLKAVQKYSPESLVMKDDKGTEKFRVAFGDNGSITPFGIVYNGVTRADDALATLTVDISDMSGLSNEDLEARVFDEYGRVKTDIEAIESRVEEAVAAVKAAREAFAIEIA